MTRLAAFLALVRKEGAAASRWRRGGTAPPHTSHTWRRKRSRRGEVRGRGGEVCTPPSTLLYSHS